MADNPQVELAYARTHLANERTFAAWLRTGLSLAAAGYAAARLLPEPTAGWAIGAVLVLLGSATILVGAWSFHRVSCRLSEAGASPTPVTRTAVYLVAVLLTVLLLMLLLLL